MTRKRFSLQRTAEELAIINWQWRFKNMTSEIIFTKQIGRERFLQARRCDYEETGTGQIIERGASDPEFISEIQVSLENQQAAPFFLKITADEFVKITIT